MSTVLSEFIQLLVGGIVDLAKGIAEGVAEMAKALFLETDASTHAVTGLSVFGGIIAIFARTDFGEVKSRKIGEGLNTNTELTYSMA